MKTSKADKKPSVTKGQKQKTLTQLHFCIDKSIIKTCASCGLSYTKGAEEDEALHKKHCMRAQKGMEWGREEEKEGTKAGVKEVASGVKMKDGKKGRIICVNADMKGKIGSKLATLFETMNVVLSASTLSPPVLKVSKAYIFLLPGTIPTREKIIGCAIAQSIETAMAIVPSSSGPAELSTPRTVIMHVDDSTSIFCDPTPLPTPLGIPRIFVSSSHRLQGVATALLNAAASTFVHGCTLDPRQGQVAFSQTTGDGLNLMRKWGCMRMYDEDDSEVRSRLTRKLD
ncbi:hypothetical protein K435DRAFT_825241 [Dendrothele bispora CBS 962.96]|uniref:N-acetyltransferase ECO1 n=1 Tax=Dendrothele bispora (strain CBS 962.96) TaxID=1314807 RepID=A0A4S8MX40_DENBC|nr:hypothetical protein K435DRAFT_825241 [Dendrothele bispora CBS 962.96]